MANYKRNIVKTFFILSFGLLFSASLENYLAPMSIQKELVIIDSFQNPDLNPHTATYVSESQILNGLYEGLFSYDPRYLEAVPALAESYKVSRNKLVWTFKIRSGVKFSDGEDITAFSIRDSWLRLLSPDLNAPFASMLDCIEGAEDFRLGKIKDVSKVGIVANDSSTLIVRLNSPTEHFPKLLCHHAFSAVSKNKNVYSGAFVLQERGLNYIRIVKNEKYWDAKSVLLPSIKIICSDDIEKNTYLFNIGNADWVSSSINSNALLNTQSIMISPQFGTEYYFFKSDKAPWNNALVRSALLEAVNWSELRKSSFISAQTLILPLQGYPEVYGLNECNLENAKVLLKKAAVGKLPVLRICVTDDYVSRAKADVLKKSWESIGVNVELIFAKSIEYLDCIKNTDADIFSYTWIGDFADPLAFLELFRSNSSLNETGWKNEKYDSLLVQASEITDKTSRYAKLAEAEQLLLDDGVIIPVSHTISFNVIDNEHLAGWFDNALDIHPYKYIYFMNGKKNENVVMNK